MSCTRQYTVFDRNTHPASALANCDAGFMYMLFVIQICYKVLWHLAFNKIFIRNIRIGVSFIRNRAYGGGGGRGNQSKDHLKMF